MTKNPFINALSATVYIALIVSLMNFLTHNLGNKPDSPFAPVVFLSLLTLSVTVMAYLFFYQPFVLFIDGKKKQATKLFAQTVGVFAVLTVVVLALLFWKAM